MESFVVRVWLPDRPGALGHVASRIGALRGDVVGIDILERGGGFAVDELVVTLPDDGLVDLLVAEIMQVDGVAVEDVRKVASDRPDAGLIALDIAARLAEAPAPARLDLLCASLADLLDGDWVAALDATTSTVVATATGPSGATVAVPDAGWLTAFLDGSRHLDEAAQAAGAPGDLAWGWLGGAAHLSPVAPALEPEVADPGDAAAVGDAGARQLVVVIGRSGRPFHMRERQQTGLLCRTAAALLRADSDPVPEPRRHPAGPPHPAVATHTPPAA